MKHLHTFRVEWADTDAAGIAFYPNFFKWFDNATWRLLFAVGLSRDVLRDQYGLLGCPIVEAHSQFFRPALFWDEIELESEVTVLGRKSFTVTHALRAGGELRAQGWEKRVMARAPRGADGPMEAVVIPDDIRRLFAVAGA